MRIFKLPKIIGHRGACGIAPENTMSSLIEASKLNLSFVEIDVKVSKDLIPILFHDEKLNRTTNGNGFCCEYSFDELSLLDAGKWFNKRFEGEKILSLSECLDFLYDNKINVNIELKPNIGKEIDNVKNIIDIIKSKKNITEYYFSTFDLLSLRTVFNISPYTSRGFLIDNDSFYNKYEIIDICKKYDCFMVGIDNKIVTSEIINFFKKNNLFVSVYTINDINYANNLFSMGVDSIFTDRPDIFDIYLS